MCSQEKQEQEFLKKYKEYCSLFEKKHSDIYASAYVKSGQTWLQMILYQLTTDGSMNFNHISEVSPWLLLCAERNISVPKLPHPRILKTHDSYSHFSKNTKGRFVHIFRDGKDVIFSRYHFLVNFLHYQGTFDDHFAWFMGEKEAPSNLSRLDCIWQNWFLFQKNWLENKNKLPILYIQYEELISSFDQCLNRIIEFLELKVSDDVLRRTKKRSSFLFMKEHWIKFGPKDRENTSFFRSGKKNEGKKYLSPEQIEIYDQNYNKVLRYLIANIEQAN